MLKSGHHCYMQAMIIKALNISQFQFDSRIDAGYQVHLPVAEKEVTQHVLLIFSVETSKDLVLLGTQRKLSVSKQKRKNIELCLLIRRKTKLPTVNKVFQYHASNRVCIFVQLTDKFTTASIVIPNGKSVYLLMGFI